ncbi:hypothetical protein C6P45_002357 [Maudiozyma exigua]|uniref:Uncharacterized protein n=1 Tax=Maudiozyma exigua TaxID=34358 RepID=A0A9P6WCX5_MAUEX|nr:hypothetical protein C6P45_002357 [Kazachstania exigua]
MVTPPFIPDINWNQLDSNSTINTNKANTPTTYKQSFAHSHRYPIPHTHSHPYDTSHSHSHAFLEYNYNVLTPTNDNTMIQGHAVSIEGTLGTVTNPENIHLALLNNQKEDNKLIHLDPVPNFIDKADIKPWLQKIFYPQGIELVIERSDNTKVVFKCKASKRGKNAKEPMITQTETEDSTTVNQQKKKKKRSVSRFNVCPFRIRATYSLKRKKWGIVVLNNSHSHDLEFNPNSEEYKKFKDKLKSDNDIEAIKKFDELEYRIRVHLPIQNTMIPCDCGMTSEIQSFNIVLPNTNTTSKNNNVIHKPQLKKKNDTLFQRAAKKNLMAIHQRNRDSESSSTGTPESTNPDSQQDDTNSLAPLNTTIPDFIDNQFGPMKEYDSTDNMLYVNNSGILPMNLTESKDVMDLNEIDFTNIFTKSFSGTTTTNNNNNIQSNTNLTTSAAAMETTLNSNILVSDDTNSHGLTKHEFDMIDTLTPDSSLSLFHHNDFTNHTDVLLNEPRSRLGSRNGLDVDYTTDINRTVNAINMNHSQQHQHHPLETTSTTTMEQLSRNNDIDLTKELDILNMTHSDNTTNPISKEIFNMDKYQIKNEPSSSNLTYHTTHNNNDPLAKIHESDDQISNWLSSLSQQHSHK